MLPTNIDDLPIRQYLVAISLGREDGKIIADCFGYYDLATTIDSWKKRLTTGTRFEILCVETGEVTFDSVRGDEVWPEG